MLPRVFVVDDTEEDRSLIEAFVKDTHLEVLKFDGWSDSIATSLTQDDLLITDVMLPEKDGVDILARLGELNYKGSVIVMSGADASLLNSVCYMAEHLGLKLIGSLRKPFDYAHFCRLLTMFLRRPTMRYNTEVSPVVLSPDDLDQIITSDLYFPVYQPQLDTKEGIVVGLECLTRVAHPSRGKIAPSAFIKALTQHNRIDEYSLKLAARALNEISPILSRFPNLRFSLNFETASLHPDFIAHFNEVLGKSGVPAQRITIELTEGREFKLDADLLFAANKIRTSGAGLSLDDCGTGFSSLEVLHDLPLTELKIDRSFVTDIHLNTKSQEIVRTLVSLSKSINVNLVGEGVETQEQKITLEGIGCSVVQGYLFSEPLLIHDLQTYFDS